MTVANEVRKGNRMISETATVSSAPGNLGNGIRMSTTSEGDGLLEELRAAYQGLGREERQQVKTLMLTLARAIALGTNSTQESNSM